MPKKRVPKQPIVWLITDNKPGHKSQLRGLAAALESQGQVSNHWLEVDSLWDFLRQLPHVKQLPRPTFIVAAGRTTHLPLVLSRRLFGGVAVLLMRPSLPYRCFDYVVVPAHDHPPQRSRILVTKGALNEIPPSQVANPNKGLLLLGGSAAHYGWDSAALLSQLDQLFTAMPQVSWTLTTSRRTPPDFLRQLSPAAFSHLPAITLVPHQQTDRQWLLQQIAASGVIWVTEDSVSMIYEALSSGAAVGVLAMPRKAVGRVAKGVDQLLQEQRLTPLKALLENGEMYPAVAPLQEAQRIAGILLRHLN